MTHRHETDFLDTLRGFAAFWVVIAHCFIWADRPLPGWADPKLAVDLFMVISGFLMTYTVDRQPGWRDFYIRRFFRIAPAYYVTLLAVVLLWPSIAAGMGQLQALSDKWQPAYRPAAQDFSVGNIIAHLTFLFGLSPDRSFSTGLPDWSLSLEMQFYALFPLFYRMRGWPIFGFGLAAVAFTWAYPRSGLPPFDEPSLLPFGLAFFCIGMLLHDARRRPWLAAPAVALFLPWLWWRGADLAMLVAATAGGAALWLSRSSIRPPRIGAAVSYSVYLAHMPVIALVGAPVLFRFGFPAMLVCVLAATIGVSLILHWLVERPGIEAGKWLVARLRPSQVHGQPAAARR